jgi:hypothetical protein
MTTFIGLCVWLACILLATWIGFDRGRWGVGLILGLLCGPLGVVAAGLMLPSVACVCEREYLVQRELTLWRRRDEAEARKRKQQRANIEAWANDVEQQLTVRELGFAEGLQELAQDLTSLGAGRAPDDARLRSWAGWLQDKAGEVRESNKYQQNT